MDMESDMSEGDMRGKRIPAPETKLENHKMKSIFLPLRLGKQIRPNG